MRDIKITNKIEVEKGFIKFDEFENLKKQAEKVAEIISSIDDSEENISEAKKVLASSRKSIKALNDKRIQIKKEFSKPLIEFEGKIKEITSIVDNAGKDLDGKIKAHEQAQRELKLELIISAYKHITSPQVQEVADFEWFMESQYLNKSFSMNKIEELIEEFGKRITEEITVIEKMDNAKEVMVEYISSKGNLVVAIDRVTSRREIEKKAMETIKPKTIDEVKKEEFCFKVEGEFNAKLIIQLMEEHGIEYEEIK